VSDGDHGTGVYAAATRVRRTVFIVYAAGLSAGTHWPRLQLGDPANPPDKMLHFTCFAGLAFFLHQARLLPGYLSLAVVGVLWTAVDEVSQLWPGLGRTFSGEDFLASSLGFLVMTALLWATRPRGERGARIRRERFERSIDELLARPVAWMAILSAGAMGAAVGLPLATFLDSLGDQPTPFQARVIGGVFGAASLAGFMVVAGTRYEERKAIANGTWRALPWLRWADVLKACTVPVTSALAALVALYGMWALMRVLSRESASVHALLRWFDSLSNGMETVVDASAVGFLCAFAVELSRRRLTRRVDDGDQECLGCGHDLRATPTGDSWGRCGECGENFWRPQGSGETSFAGSTR
jgi:VanZ family protein